MMKYRVQFEDEGGQTLELASGLDAFEVEGLVSLLQGVEILCFDEPMKMQDTSVVVSQESIFYNIQLG